MHRLSTHRGLDPAGAAGNSKFTSVAEPSILGCRILGFMFQETLGEFLTRFRGKTLFSLLPCRVSLERAAPPDAFVSMCSAFSISSASNFSITWDLLENRHKRGNQRWFKHKSNDCVELHNPTNLRSQNRSTQSSCTPGFWSLFFCELQRGQIQGKIPDLTLFYSQSGEKPHII